QQRLTAGQLMEQGLHYLRHSGGREFFANLGSSVKENPLPVALVGVGLAWLMMGGQRGDARPGLEVGYGGEDAGVSSLGEAASGTRERLGETAAAARERASGALTSTRERISGLASGARERLGGTAAAARERLASARAGARRFGASARSGVQRARGGYERMAREQPLALGAVGLAIGALLAAVLPRTRQEDALMGEARDRVAERARELAQEGAEAAQRVAHRAGEAGKEEAQRSWSEPRGEGQAERAPAAVSPGGPVPDATPGTPT